MVCLELPLFPNYVFIRIALAERSSVLAIPGVLWIVGGGLKPSAIPDSEIESLRAGVELGNLQPHPYLVVGERVRITTGPMRGMEGILLRQNNGARVVLTLDLIKSSVAVQIDSQFVEPSANHAVFHSNEAASVHSRVL